MTVVFVVVRADCNKVWPGRLIAQHRLHTFGRNAQLLQSAAREPKPQHESDANN